VERIGRYLSVFYETDAAGPRWEHMAMAFGRPPGAATVNALFSMPFLLAAVFNVAPALIVQPTVQELIFIGGAHALFVLRLVVARAAAAKQRAVDLARFTALRRD